jgi:tetratricopeptide (TPR) repeat protein
LIDSGIVVKEGEIWKAKTEISSLMVPDTIQSVIMSRIDRLEEEVKYVLQCASVIGRLFRHRLLGYTSQRERELDKYLWRLEDKELIYEERAMPELEYSFKHVLTQETAYQSLLQRRRQEFHRKVGEGIETLYKERIEEFYGELAYHYDKSGIVEKAVEYLLLAGEKTRKAYLNDAAIGYFQRALERLDGSPLGESRKDWRLAALKELGMLYRRIGRWSEAEEHFRQAIALGQGMGLPSHELVRLYEGLCGVFFFQYRYDEAIRLGEEGLTLLGEDTESVETALMHLWLGASHGNKGNRELTRKYYQRMAQFIERLPYSDDIPGLYSQLAWLYGLIEKQMDEAFKWLLTSERLAEQHHHRSALAVVWCWRLRLWVGMGDFHNIILHFPQAYNLCSAIGDAYDCSWALGNQISACLGTGNLQEAKEWSRRCLELYQHTGNTDGIAWSYWNLGQISLCQGFFEEAEDMFHKALQFLLETGIERRNEYWYQLLGRVQLLRGNRGEALKQFQESARACTAYGGDRVLWYLPPALSGLEEAYDDPEEFRAFCRRFREERPEVGNLPLMQWFLEPTEASAFPQNLLHDSFVESLSSDWAWHDQFGDCSFNVGNGLEIHAANGRDLWDINLSAPRILRLVSGDFAVQTVCESISEEKPAIGGILLWKDKENYLRLDIGTRGKREISFGGCLGNKDVIIGRGRLPSERDKEIASPSARNDTPSTVTARVSCSNVIARSEATKQSKRSEGEATKQSDFSDLPSRVFLRLERLGSKLNALCSVGGVSWFTVGHVEFLVEDPVEVGLHAIGNIDRTVYHGAFPEGTAIRFEGFEVWSR